MNRLICTHISLLLALMTCPLITSGATMLSVVDTPWEFNPTTKEWARHIGGVGGQALLTARKQHGKTYLSVTLPCGQNGKTETFAWVEPATHASSDQSCTGRKKTIFTKEWRPVFNPLPAEMLR